MPAPTPTIVVFAPEEDSSGRSWLCALRSAGFCVRQTASPTEALDLACAAALMVVDGWLGPAPALCEQARKDAATARVPILLVGEFEPPGFARSAEDPFAPDAFLPRCANASRLLALVRLLLRLHWAEEESRASQSRLQHILDLAPVAVSVKDEQGRYLLVNRCWELHFHHRRDHVIGRTVHEVFDAEEADRLAEAYRAVLASGAPLEYEETAAQSDGPHTYLKTKFALKKHGTPFAVCGIATDITERKRAEQALRSSQAMYHSLVETLPVCIFRKDLEGRFTFVNGPFCRECKRTPDEILGCRDQDLYPEDLARKYQHDDQHVIATGSMLECVEEHITPEGGKRFVQVIKAPLHDGGGAIIGMQGIFWDVTDRKSAQEELARTAADIAAARCVQQKLFPAADSPLVRKAAARGFDIGGASYPVEAVGGDYFDYFDLGEERLAVAIGDVSGHGIGPALLMAIARSYLRASARGDAAPGDVLAQVNRLLANDIEGDRYITLLLARLDMATRSFSYSSAGHTTSYILDARGAIKHILDSTAVPLGISTNETFPTTGGLQLETGDIVVLLTDGIVEARDPGRQTFDPERVLDLVRFYRRWSARQIAVNLYHAVRAFTQNNPQLDDITATVVKVG